VSKSGKSGSVEKSGLGSAVDGGGYWQKKKKKEKFAAKCGCRR